MKKQTRLPQQNSFYFEYTDIDNHQINTIIFDSVFDSGNCQDVIQVSNNTFVIYTAHDCAGTNNEGYPKSWFYFSVQGFQPQTEVIFIIRRIQILWSLYKIANDSYKPVIRIGDGVWQRLAGKSELYENKDDNQLEVTFSYTFMNNSEDKVYFAFSYPFSYTECQFLIENLVNTFKNDQDIYLNREVLIKSPQDRNIDLLTISSHDGKQDIQESFINDFIFPERDKYSRAMKFNLSKPIILITARVHPGETPSSHTMNGILNFILDKNDIRAYLLRKHFVIILIPMINPDGVYNGYYRMDYYNQNLNRYYKNPDKIKQPMIYAIKELVEYLNNESRLFFYCDLHSHAAKKGCFLYGNALDFVKQVESQLFAKVISMNCINFEYENCNFSKKQMSSRDKGETLTKEGAGRVCVYKICDIIHSYTLECGFHYTTHLNKISEPKKLTNSKGINSNLGCKEDIITNIDSPIYANHPVYCTIEIYQDIGKALMISILDIFEKNPCSRISTSSYGNLSNIRKEIAELLSKYIRFKKDMNLRKKLKKIDECSRKIFYDNFLNKSIYQDNSQNLKVMQSEKTIYIPTKIIDRSKVKEHIITQQIRLNSFIPEKKDRISCSIESFEFIDEKNELMDSIEKIITEKAMNKTKKSKDKYKLRYDFKKSDKDNQEKKNQTFLSILQLGGNIDLQGKGVINQVSSAENSYIDKTLCEKDKEKIKKIKDFRIKDKKKEICKGTIEDKHDHSMMGQIKRMIETSAQFNKFNKSIKNTSMNGFESGILSKTIEKEKDRYEPPFEKSDKIEKTDKLEKFQELGIDKARNKSMKLPKLKLEPSSNLIFKGNVIKNIANAKSNSKGFQMSSKKSIDPSQLYIPTPKETLAKDAYFPQREV